METKAKRASSAHLLKDYKERTVHPVLAFCLKSYTPTYTWVSTIALYFVLGIASIVYGLVISSVTSGVIEVKQDYTDICAGYTTCDVPITIPSLMKKPVFFYYHLETFYQNHRLYIMSQSATQLAGTEISLSEAQSSCGQASTNSDLNQTSSWGGFALVADAVASPCGVMAKSFFTDTFILKQDTTIIDLDETNIAWPNDSGVQFKQTPNSSSTQWINPEDPHFMVWMRPASSPSFRKLWAEIDQDLPAGEYKVTVSNNYNTSLLGGQRKSIILGTTSVFGNGENYTAYVYFVMGVVLLIIAVFFALKKRR